MKHMFRGVGLGYGSSGAAGAMVFALCSCALIAFGVFWLGGALAALALTLLSLRLSGARGGMPRPRRYSEQ